MYIRMAWVQVLRTSSYWSTIATISAERTDHPFRPRTSIKPLPQATESSTSYPTTTNNVLEMLTSRYVEVLLPQAAPRRILPIPEVGASPLYRSYLSVSNVRLFVSYRILRIVLNLSPHVRGFEPCRIRFLILITGSNDYTNFQEGQILDQNNKMLLTSGRVLTSVR